MLEKDAKIDVSKPLWDQSSYCGRWNHFAFITDFRTIFVPTDELCKAKKLCEEYKLGKAPPGTKQEDIIYAKKLKDAAFHPDNDELMHVVGRMSFQLPGQVILTAAMLTFYKTSVAIASCQLFNQAFNAFVNYTNRNAKSDEPDDDKVIQQAFVGATLASTAAAVGLKKFFCLSGPITARLVPFCAVAVGNMVNLPIMRHREIFRGIPVFAREADEIYLLKSKVAAIKGITECVLSRISMVAPSMLLVPIIMQNMKSQCFYQRRPWIGSPIELCLISACYLISIPSGLAIFPQFNSMKSSFLKFRPCEEDELKNAIKKGPYPDRLYYNKGL